MELRATFPKRNKTTRKLLMLLLNILHFIPTLSLLLPFDLTIASLCCSFLDFLQQRRLLRRPHRSHRLSHQVLSSLLICLFSFSKIFFSCSPPLLSSFFYFRNPSISISFSLFYMHCLFVANVPPRVRA